MLKLFRNCLGGYKCLLDGDGKEIKCFIEALAPLQDDGLREDNRLSKQHVS